MLSRKRVLTAPSFVAGVLPSPNLGERPWVSASKLEALPGAVCCIGMRCTKCNG